jgi:predicted RNA-binding protein with PIN domain
MDKNRNRRRPRPFRNGQPTTAAFHVAYPSLYIVTALILIVLCHCDDAFPTFRIKHLQCGSGSGSSYVKRSCNTLLQQSSSSTTRLYMGKGDGKKKRKKKAASVTESTSVNAKPPPPPRVTNAVNIPVRRQLAYAQRNKQARTSATTTSSFRRTKYRRTWDDEEREQKAQERRRRGQNPNWDVVLNQTSAAPLVLVDGYNIIHKWSRLKKHFVRGDLHHARHLLVEDLENLRAVKGWRIECVFDGAGRSAIGPLGQTGRGAPQISRRQQQSTTSVSKHGVRVVFTGVGVEADAYIEARCARAKNATGGAFTGSLIVATDDGMIRMAGTSAGALCMGADRFVTELKALKNIIAHQVEAAVAKANGHAIRPEKFRGTSVYASRFGRGSVLVIDKRNKTKTIRKLEEIPPMNMAVVEKETKIPSWALVPNRTWR